ncbi:MAG: hypothetical protein KA428_09015 [Chitinophagaceae bacterium]|nr:hypothetical protein [Chitinophagaceae bacterium]MBP6233395.1 hypothetical protein [Chitinophagaceae bacterium]
MKKASLVLLLLFPVIGFSQHFIGKSKPQVMKELQKQIVKNDSLTITLTDTDSGLVYSIKAQKVLPADFVYSFDNTGKCQSEKVIAGCDSCYKKFLQKVLAEKKYDWKKINENQYISKYESRMMIELPTDNKNYQYTILKTEWTKELYDILNGN